MLAAASAELEGALARAGRLVAQLAAGERQEHAFEARLLDDEPADAAAEAREECLGERLAARLDDDLGVLAMGESG